MAQQSPIGLLPGDQDRTIIMPPIIPAAPEQLAVVADPEQVRAVETLFATPDKEPSAVSGLLGLWTSTILLNDMAKEIFHVPADEREPEPEKPKDEE